MNAVYLTGHVLVADILVALEPMLSVELLGELDKELAGKTDERLEFDDCEVLADEAVDALDDADKLPEPEGLDYLLEERDVIGLAEAIRCGEREAAELLLDRLFANASEFSTIREWIDRGRFSMKARKTVKRTAEPERKAA